MGIPVEREINTPTIDNALVAYIDILGFKQLVRTDPVKASLHLEKVQIFAHKIVQQKEQVFGMAISDSIFLYVDIGNEESIPQFFECIDSIMSQSFVSGPITLMRTGIAAGELKVNKTLMGTPKFFSTIVMGQAFIEAYKLSETPGVGLKCLLSDGAKEIVKHYKSDCLLHTHHGNEYAWYMSSSQYTHPYAETYLDQINKESNDPKVAINQADTLELLLNLSDSKEAYRKALCWLIQSKCCHHALIVRLFDRYL